MLATTTVTVRRSTTGDVAQAGMVDPWDVVDTDAHEPGTVVCQVPGAVVQPSVQSRIAGGTRQQTDWVLYVAPDTDVAIGDTVTDDQTGVVFRATQVVTRPVPLGMSLPHVAIGLVRVDGEAGE